MKTTSQAIMASALIHVAYFAITIGTGFVKTLSYQPDFNQARGTAQVLQRETEFGFTVSPAIFVLTFAGTALLSGILLSVFKRRKTLVS